MTTSLRRLMFVFAPLFAFVIPILAVMGIPALFGTGGWGMILTVFIIGPIMIVSLLILYSLLMARPSVRTTKQVSRMDARIMLSLYASIIITGLFFVDGGDTTESVQSAMTKMLGIGFGVSTTISIIAGIVMIGLFVVAFIVFIKELVVERRSSQVNRL